MFGLGMGEMLLIGAGVLLLFGSKKIPELGSGLAKGIKNFKKGMNEVEDEKKDEEDKKIES